MFVCSGGYVCRRRDRCGGQSVNCGRGGSGLLVLVYIVLVLVLVLVPVHIVLVLVLVLVQVLVHIAAPGSGVASQGCSALLHRTPLLSASASTFLLSRATVASRIRTGVVLAGQPDQQSVPSANCSQFRPFFTHSCPEHFLVSLLLLILTLFSGEGNGGSLEFAMPPLRGKDESDVALAPAAGLHSGRLGAEADGAAPWLHGGGGQRGDPGPGPARVGLPLPVHLLPLPAAPRSWAVCQWSRSPEGPVHCSWSSLPFPC